MYLFLVEINDHDSTYIPTKKRKKKKIGEKKRMTNMVLAQERVFTRTAG